MPHEVLGILSDSHGRVGTTASAVRLLTEHGANRLIHLGDVGSEEVLDELVGHRAHVVFGNCDDEVVELSSYARHVDITVDHPLGWLTLDGKTIAFTHGHLHSALDEALERSPDYLLHGHSHELRDERAESTRIINPGALFRARRYTAALLEPATDRLEVIEIPHT